MRASFRPIRTAACFGSISTPLVWYLRFRELFVLFQKRSFTNYAKSSLLNPFSRDE